jgi:hydrogenase maturation factor
MINVETYCAKDPIDGHCVTCTDEILLAKVLQVDSVNGIAVVQIEAQEMEIDVSLVEQVQPGTVVLVHGGVAIDRLEEEKRA